MKADEWERARMAAAMQRMNDLLLDIGGDVNARMHERCPYRAADDRCTFGGGCVNQRRARDVAAPAAVVRCGGDHQLRRSTP